VVVQQTTLQDNGGNGIFVGRGAQGEIGGAVFGGVTGTNTITRSGRGINVEGGHATILGTTITASIFQGISFFNGANGRIGIRVDDSALVGNTVSGSGGSGIEISTGATAVLGGNTIRDNGTSSTGSRFGLGVFAATASLAGGNLIENHPQSGIFVSRGGVVFVGARHGSLPFTNTIRNNGINGNGTYGGLFAFQNGVADVRDATFDQNQGYGVLAFKGSNISMRNVTITGSTAQPGDTFASGRGVIASLHGIVRLRESFTISGNAGDGIAMQQASSVDLRNDGIGTKQIVNNGGFGVACFGTQSAFGNPGGGIILDATNALGPTNGACTGWE
jgi:parallel beta-helix repeat protein